MIGYNRPECGRTWKSLTLAYLQLSLESLLVLYYFLVIEYLAAHLASHCGALAKLRRSDKPLYLKLARCWFEDGKCKFNAIYR